MMAFDQPTRNRLQRFVNDARKVLEEEFTRQLQNDYGLDPVSGTVTAMDKLRHLNDAQRETARILRDTLAHYRASQQADPRTGLDRIVREQAFTVLNRLAALRLAEARGLLVESVGNGYQAKGFQLYARLAGTGLGETGDAYRCYLFSVFDELAQDLPPLFDRYAPQGRLFPREAALLQVLPLINHPELEPLWAEDETIGWIYQYFNSKEERKAMRDASQAPRNSRELAVRNQFFTPRYVVEFLVDNTLGRTWYEMCQGQTALKDTCQYLVRRPNEVFLARSTAEEEGENEVRILADALRQGRIPDWPAEDRAQEDLAIQLGHCVDAYQRGGSPATHVQLEEQYRALDDLKTVPLQELWDFLFLCARADRQSGGGTFHRDDLAMGAAQEILDRLRVDERAERSQEELLRAPVLVPYRPRKDPRALKILDPACGSGHFLLYAFDLLATIYEEAWKAYEEFRELFSACWIKADSITVRDWDQVTCFASGDQLDRETAMLVVHSFGPDDPSDRFHIYSPEKARSTSDIYFIGRLADTDWKSFLDAGWVTPYAFRGNRPDYITSEEYTEEEALANFGRLIPRLIIEHNLYGVDIDPRAAQIASLALWLRAQRAWHEGGIPAQDRPRIGRGHIVAAVAPPAEQDLRNQFAEQLDFLDAELFEKTLDLLKGLPELGVLLQVERELPQLIRRIYPSHGDLFEQEDMEQWEKAEARLRSALTNFAQAARATYQGRLFAQDALEGLRMIDLCREVFDVVVMNPPFGEPTESSKEYVFANYSQAKYDLAATLWERATQILETDGLIGCLANRTIFFGQMLEYWRRSLFVENGILEICFDLGLGVLDSAMVEAMASVSRKSRSAAPTIFVKESEAPETILKHIKAYRSSNTSGSTYEICVRSFLQLPGFPFSYWIPEKWLSAYLAFETLESQGVIAKQGMESSDNFRFVRLWWECSSSATYWKPYSKGGSFGPQWRDVDVAVNWKDAGKEVKAFSSSIYGTWTKQITNSEHYGKPGIVYPASRVEFSPRLIPSGNVIGCKGPIVLLSNEEFSEDRYLRLLAVLSSSSFRALLNLTTTSGDTMRKSYREKAVVQTPSPKLEHVPPQAVDLVSSIIAKLRLLDSGCEIKRSFTTLLDSESRLALVSEIRQMRTKLDLLIGDIYGFCGPDYIAWQTTGYDDLKEYSTEDYHEVISYLFGCAFGRWPLIPLSQGQRDPISNSPFDEIPKAFDGLGHHYTLQPRVIENGSWPTIIPQFESDSTDIWRVLSSYLDAMVGENSATTEHRLAQALKVSSVWEYIQKEKGFFDAHLTQYSQSRRSAPIYWPLTTTSGSYTLWVYYPSLTSQTLYTAINDYVEPRLKQVGADVTALRNKGADRTREDEKQFESLQAFELELIELRDTLLKIAPTYHPNHDDGVQITAAPLWPLFRHKPWQKVLKATWAKLEKGDYDWAHLALHYWPDRVREKCKTDKSLAIAHDLEDLYIEPPAKAKKTRAKKKPGGGK